MIPKVHSRNIELFPFEKEGKINISKAQNQVVLPSYVDEFSYVRRLTSKTAISALASVTQGLEVDFDLISPNGHIQEVFAEIALAELGGTTQSTFLGYDIFDRIDIEIGGTVFRSIYPDELWYLEKLSVNQLEFNRMKAAEHVQANYQPVASTISPGGITLFYLRLPLFTYELPDLRWLAQPPLIRCYFKTPASFVTSGSTNLGISYFNMIIKQFPTPLVNLSIDKTFRYINWSRYSNVVSLNPNSQYTYQLNTLMGESAMLVIMFRSSPVYSNGNNFLQLQNALQAFELHDESNNIISISHTPYLNFSVLNRPLSGDYFDSAFYPYIYTLIFSKNPDKIHTQVTGSYRFTSKENFQFNTSPVLVAGTYEITVWSADYNYYTIGRNGSFTFTRN